MHCLAPIEYILSLQKWVPAYKLEGIIGQRLDLPLSEQKLSSHHHLNNVLQKVTVSLTSWVSCCPVLESTRTEKPLLWETSLMLHYLRGAEAWVSSAEQHPWVVEARIVLGLVWLVWIRPWQINSSLHKSHAPQSSWSEWVLPRLFLFSLPLVLLLCFVMFLFSGGKKRTSYFLNAWLSLLTFSPYFHRHYAWLFFNLKEGGVCVCQETMEYDCLPQNGFRIHKWRIQPEIRRRHCCQRKMNLQRIGSSQENRSLFEKAKAYTENGSIEKYEYAGKTIT